MFERFTDRARRAVVLAQEHARLLDHDFIGTEHILLGLLSESEGVAARALAALGVTLETLGTRRGDVADQPHEALLVAPPPGARGRLERRPGRRNQGPGVHPARQQGGENPRIVASGPRGGQLDFPTDTSGNDRRDGRARVEYDEIMRYFAHFDSRLPKDPPQRPPDPEVDDPPGDPPLTEVECLIVLSSAIDGFAKSGGPPWGRQKKGEVGGPPFLACSPAWRRS